MMVVFLLNLGGRRIGGRPIEIVLLFDMIDSLPERRLFPYVVAYEYVAPRLNDKIYVYRLVAILIVLRCSLEWALYLA